METFVTLYSYVRYWMSNSVFNDDIAIVSFYPENSGSGSQFLSIFILVCNGNAQGLPMNLIDKLLNPSRNYANETNGI